MKKYIILALPFLLFAEQVAKLAPKSDITTKVLEAIDILKKVADLPIDNTFTGQARGYKEIKLFCDNVIHNIEMIIEDDNLSNDEKQLQAHHQVILLDDESKVYQAKKGLDFAYLEGAKAQGAALVASIGR